MTTPMRDYDSAVTRKPMKNRVVRVADEDWEAALRRAEAEDTVWAEELRKFIQRYGRDYRKP